MPLPTRLELARAAYGRAIAAARTRNDAVSWRRLVRAGQNLRDVLTEQEGPRRWSTVLLAAGERESREAIRRMLEAQGIRVVAATDGLAALELLRRRRVFPRVIVLDLAQAALWDLRRELLRDPLLARIPVIIIVAGARAPAPPAVRRVEKPFEVAALVEAIRAARP